MTVLDYEKLYNSYYLQVYSYVMTIVKNQHQAEEITQNTFYKAMTAKKAYAGRSSELTWLCSIARNLAMDECRKNTKFTELDAELLGRFFNEGVKSVITIGVMGDPTSSSAEKGIRQSNNINKYLFISLFKLY